MYSIKANNEDQLWQELTFHNFYCHPHVLCNQIVYIEILHVHQPRTDRSLSILYAWTE